MLFTTSAYLPYFSFYQNLWGTHEQLFLLEISFKFQKFQFVASYFFSANLFLILLQVHFILNGSKYYYRQVDGLVGWPMGDRRREYWTGQRMEWLTNWRTLWILRISRSYKRFKRSSSQGLVRAWKQWKFVKIPLYYQPFMRYSHLKSKSVRGTHLVDLGLKVEFWFRHKSLFKSLKINLNLWNFVNSNLDCTCNFCHYRRWHKSHYYDRVSCKFRGLLENKLEIRIEKYKF